MLAYFPDAVDADVNAAQNPELDEPNENPLDSNVEDGSAAAAPNPELEKPIGIPPDPPMKMKMVVRLLLRIPNRNVVVGLLLSMSY